MMTSVFIKRGKDTEKHSGKNHVNTEAGEPLPQTGNARRHQTPEKSQRESSLRALRNCGVLLTPSF